MKTCDQLLEEGVRFDRDLILRDIRTICFRVASTAKELRKVELEESQHVQWAKMKLVMAQARDDFLDLHNKINMGMKQRPWKG
jgi:hypothetical protein